MAHSHSSSRGCGSCGGGSYQPPEPPPPVYDPCAGGLTTSARARECACGGGCGTRVPRTRTYDREQCPTFAISCETKLAVRDCLKDALCELLRCVSDTLCPDGRFDIETLRGSETLREDLINCVGQAACTFMHCLPDALCPEPCETTVPVDCLPCGYAVEVVQ